MVTAAKARLSVRVPGCQQLQRKLNPVWHRMLYSWPILHVCCSSHVPLFFWFYLSIMNWLSTDFRNQLYLYKPFPFPECSTPLGHRVTAGPQSDRWVTEWPLPLGHSLGHRVTAGPQSDHWVRLTFEKCCVIVCVLTENLSPKPDAKSRKRKITSQVSQTVKQRRSHVSILIRV